MNCTDAGDESVRQRVWERNTDRAVGGENIMIIFGRGRIKCEIILKWKKQEMKAWTGFIWLKIGTGEAFFSELQ